ncbi:cutinase family protein [Corynebacterium yonathiae]|uniref:Cutinase family protein n=1 Tax=Corynebacterium yonathiae TaxID=2913504 RepID=A0A9X3RL70_9CORY|nr:MULTISPECIES: cutinase family protein [Corynebacterium]MCZ9296044.1 cutinase family protein [Corynebacterium yonathiae]MDK2583239.1 cutinase family protein [Corynebacterium sp. BWA136]
MIRSAFFRAAVALSASAALAVSIAPAAATANAAPVVPQAAAQSAPSPQPAGCPEFVVLAARGSDQNEEYGEYFGPQQYSPHAAPSNGYEGANLSALFHLVEKRHPGTMDRVHVLALDPQAYPASMNLPPLAQEGEQLNPLQLIRRLGGVVMEYPLHELAYSVTVGFVHSLRTGMANAPRVVEKYERETGCQPRYITAGYSQGAIVATSAERYLAQRGKLAGAVYLGNPLSRPHGMAGWLPQHLLLQPAALPDSRRLNYCLDGDFVCDLNLASAHDALATKAARHASYFVEPSLGDAAFADSLATLLTPSSAGDYNHHP